MKGAGSQQESLPLTSLWETWKSEGRAEFAYIIIICKTQSASQTKKAVRLISPTHLCYKLSQDLKTRLGPHIPVDKEEREDDGQNVEVVHPGWMEVGKKPKQKEVYKPSGHLSSLGTRMFQSQNLALVEFQGFREKSKLKRGSQTCVCVYIYIIYIYNG